MYSGTFDSYVIKISLLSFGAFPIFDNLVTPKRGAERIKIWASLSLLSYYTYIQGTFIVKCSRSF